MHEVNNRCPCKLLFLKGRLILEALEKKPNPESGIDSGLISFIIIANYHGLAADPSQIRHQLALGDEKVSDFEILKIAKNFKLKAKVIQSNTEKITKLTFPAIAEFNSGEYVVLGKVDQDKVLLISAHKRNPEMMSMDDFKSRWTGKIILFVKRSFIDEQQKFGMKWFIPTILKYRKMFSEVLIATFTLQLFGLVTPIITQVIIDKVLVHNGISTLNVLIIGLIAIALFEVTLSIAKNYVFVHTTSRIDVTLGAKLFKHMCYLPLRYFEVRRIGETIARVRELENVRRFITGPPLTSGLDAMFIVVYIAVMFFYSTTLTFVVLGVLPIYVLLSAIITPLLRRRLEESFQRGAQSQSFLVEAVSGIQTIKSFALEPEMNKKWENLLSDYTKANFKTANLSGIAGALGQFIQRVSYLVILWLGAHLVIKGTISLGQLIAFQMLSGRVSEPVLRLVQMWQDYQQAGISIKKLSDVLNTRTEISVDTVKTRLPMIKGHIRFENVRFRYDVDGPEIIRNLSIDIRPGTTVGVVGRSGSGKSTLSKLIQRLYIPESGKILIDGIDLSLADTAWLRRQIGVVLQENFLFNGTIRENIAIHYPSASMEQIIHAAQLAGAHQFILELREGYDTMVGEKGSSLSGGQRQRVAIARALLTNPRILIFDEATSALDYESEKIIQANINKICEGRTVIIIAHRLSTLQDADKIIVIDRGELKEFGSHEELMKREGLYRYLYSQQERGL